MGGLPARTASQRSASATPASAEATCCPQPTHVAFPHAQVILRHILES